MNDQIAGCKMIVDKDVELLGMFHVHRYLSLYGFHRRMQQKFLSR
jgi:hypothetical protein